MLKDRSLKPHGCVYLHPHTCVLWLKFLDRLDKPVHLKQTHDLRVKVRREKERNEDRRHRLSRTLALNALQLKLCALSVYILRKYVHDTKTMHCDYDCLHMSTRLNGGREFLSQIKSSSISSGTSVSMCVSRVGLLICKNTLPSALPTQLALGVYCWLI